MVEKKDPEVRSLGVAVGNLRDAFLECRTIGHSWRLRFIGLANRADEDVATRARHHPQRPDGVRVLRCSRCRTERVDLCDIGYGRAAYAYRMVSRFYRYPEEYAMEAGVQTHRYLLHEELFRRHLGGDEE